MKITKAYLTEIIKGVITEEAYDCEQDYRMGGMTYEEYKQCLADAEDEEDGYYEEGARRRGLQEYTGEPISSKEAPELIKTWEKEIMDWLRQQFNPQYPLEESQEIPMIVTALENVRTKLKDMRAQPMRERSERGYRGPHKDIYDLGYGAGVRNNTDQNDEAFEKYGYDTPEGNAWSQGWNDGMGDGGWN